MKAIAVISLIFLFSLPCLSEAEDHSSASASPKSGWGNFEVVEEPAPHETTARQILLWLPNRLLDLIDIFHVDVGVGPAYGGVVRITQYAQAGYREMNPASARIGLLGRRFPFKVEKSNEIGIGPSFAQSSERTICKGEIGAGLDVIIAGAYAGVCVDEFVDFVGGIFTFDMKNDDLH